MLKRSIKYTDFNDEEQEDVYYFHFSKAELLELDARYEGGLQGMLQRLIDTRDKNEIIMMMKKIVLDSYGVKSDDGKRFIKTDELREEFCQTAAYSALFMELATDDGAAAIFMKGILPKGLAEEAEKQAATTAQIPST